MATYIIVLPSTLVVTVRKSEHRTKTAILVPDPGETNRAHPVAKMVLYDILEAAHRKREKERLKGTDTHFSLAPPDPWLLALATVMWQGIVQGMAWDAVKVSVAAGLRSLRAAGLAPHSGVTDSETLWRLGFTWTEYCEEERQREMFVGLSKLHRRKMKQRSQPKSAGRTSKQSAAGKRDSKPKKWKARRKK